MEYIIAFIAGVLLESGMDNVKDKKNPTNVRRVLIFLIAIAYVLLATILIIVGLPLFRNGNPYGGLCITGFGVFLMVLAIIIVIRVNRRLKKEGGDTKKINFSNAGREKIKILSVILAQILLVVLGVILFSQSFSEDIRIGIDNYDKGYYLGEYGGDLGSNLSIFPDDKSKLVDARFESALQTILDTDGYILLDVKYGDEDFQNEISRLENIAIEIKNGCKKNAEKFTNTIKYDASSYKYPAYVAIDGFDGTYEYALIDEMKKEIVYLYLSYPSIDDSRYSEYLKVDKTFYSKADTVEAYSIYYHSFDGGRSFMGHNDGCTDEPVV